jgi:MFS family permease
MTVEKCVAEPVWKPHRRVLIASLVGTTVEFYDFYVYATAASLFFGPLFFPSADPSAQLLLAFATLGLAFVARPVGAVVFGHFGDRIGRKSTLVASLLLMGVSTTLIAFLPTYEQAGWVASLLLCLLRFGQGLGLGGEWGGAALLAVENAPPGWRGRFGMVPQLGAPLGFIAANSFFLLLGELLSDQAMREWGWRIPFLASAVLVALGLWVRVKLAETPAFAAALAEAPPEAEPLAAKARKHLGVTVIGTFGVVACFALYYITTAFALGYGTTALGYDRNAFLLIQLGAILFMAAGIVLAGIASDRFDARRSLIVGCAATIVAGLLIAPMLGSGSLLLAFLFLSFALSAMGFTYGPLGAWLPELFPAKVRYTGCSIAFNVGGILGGALTPIVAQVLASSYGLGWVGLYCSACGLLSLVVLVIARGKEAREV